MVPNMHRILRLKVRNLQDIFDVQAATLLVCPYLPLRGLRSLSSVLGVYGRHCGCLPSCPFPVSPSVRALQF